MAICCQAGQRRRLPRTKSRLDASLRPNFIITVNAVDAFLTWRNTFHLDLAFDQASRTGRR